MPPITNDWAEHLKEEYKKPYYKKLYQTVTAEYAQKNIFPRRMIFLTRST